jgi:anti-sigma factor RsiW
MRENSEMNTRPAADARIAEDDLHALVDGRLSPAAAAALRERLASDPQAQAAAEAWQAQREAIRRAYPSGGEQPVPASLSAAAGRTQDALDNASQWWRWGGIAASVLVAFGLGWSASGLYGAGNAAGPFARAQPAHRFAQQAAVAHVVFQPEVRHPVEVTAAQQEHLVQWLSKRLGRPLKVPLLTAQGYELMGGRLLPGDDGARAQFMYQNAAGQRLTLYLGALKPGAADARETSFRFLDDGPVPGFYWVDQGFGYALAGQLPRPALQELARAVYAQL